MSIPDNILPSSIRDEPHIAAFDATMREMLATVDVSAVLVYLTEIVAESALDTLIDQWGLNSGAFSMRTATVAAKRKILREAALLNRRRGTIWALRYIFEANGIEEIHVAEAEELNISRYYDGTWRHNGAILHGFQWLWAEYAIIIYADNMTATLTQQLLDTMSAGLLSYAPARCHHIGYTMRVRGPEEIAVGDSLNIVFTP